MSIKWTIKRQRKLPLPNRGHSSWREWPFLEKRLGKLVGVEAAFSEPWDQLWSAFRGREKWIHWMLGLNRRSWGWTRWQNVGWSPVWLFFTWRLDLQQGPQNTTKWFVMTELPADSRKGLDLHASLGPNKMPHGNTGTRRKGDSKYIHMCYQQMISGFPKAMEIKRFKKSQFTCKWQEDLWWTCELDMCRWKCFVSSRTPLQERGRQRLFTKL